MANLKEIRDRIEATRSMEQITSAMKMVSASKLRKSQNLVVKLRPYAFQLHHMIARMVFDGYANIQSPFLQERPEKKVLLIVVTSNSGLCGSFNTVVLKEAMNHIENVYMKNPDTKEISIMCIGRKATEFFQKQTKFKLNMLESHDYLLDNLTYEAVDELGEKLLQDYKKHVYDRIDQISNDFVNAAVYKTRIRRRLPFNIEDCRIDGYTDNNYIFLPSKEDVVHNIIPKSFKVRLYMRILESLAAEHGARMTSMHKATENASQLQKELKLSYNKARQAAITNEIIEITNGANALTMQ